MKSDSERPALSIGSAISESWARLKPNLGTFILAMLVGAGVSYLLSYFGGIINPDPGHANGTSFIFSILSLLVNVVFGIGLIRMAIKTVNGERPLVSDLTYALSDGDLFWRYLVTQVLLFVIVTLGLVALIIPGIYLFLTYAFAQYFVVDKGSSTSKAFHQSAEMMNGNQLQFLGLVLALSIINVIGAALVGLGLFITLPLTAITMVHAYRQLSGTPPKAVEKKEDEDESGEQPKMINDMEEKPVTKATPSDKAKTASKKKS
ncbi:MAG: hypothetical protein WCO52_04415 [bacterium]